MLNPQATIYIRLKEGKILERGVANKQKHLFLESFHCALEPNAANEREPFPRAYMPL